MKRLLAALLLCGLPAIVSAQAITGTATAAANSISVEACVVGLPTSTSCTFTLKDETGAIVDTKTSPSGGACRSIDHTGLSNNTGYRVNVDCGLPYDLVVNNPIATTSDPGGTAPLRVQVPDPTTFPAASRCTVAHGATVATMSTTTQNTSCGSGATISPDVARGVWYYEVRLQDGSNNILARSSPTRVVVGDVNRISLTSSANGDEPSVPQLSALNSRLLSEGADRCSKLVDYGSTYYDSAYTYWELSDYFHDRATWIPCMDTANDYYRDGYALLNNGAIPGYWRFTAGQRKHFEEQGVGKDLRLLALTSNSGAYCGGGPGQADHINAATPYSSRENAYCFRARMDAVKLGIRDATAADLTWFRDRTKLIMNGPAGWSDPATTYRWPTPEPNYPAWAGMFVFQPFMGALSIFSLAQCIDEFPDLCGADEKAAIVTMVDFINQAWDPARQAHWYINAKTLPSDPWPAAAGAPDLGMEMASVNALAYKYTCDTSYRDMADAAFAGSVNAAYIDAHKQFNEYTYWTIYTYLAIRGPKGTKKADGTSDWLWNDNNPIIRSVACP